MLPNPLEDIARRLVNYEKRLAHLERLEGGGVWTLIENIALGAPGVFTFNNIPGTFSHLCIIGSLRGTRAVTGVAVRTRFNNDTGNNYDSIRETITHVNTLVTGENINTSSITGPTVAASASLANFFSPFVAHIPLYSSGNIFKSIMIESYNERTASTGDLEDTRAKGVWKNTAAITRIDILVADPIDTFLANSELSLYGIN